MEIPGWAKLVSAGVVGTIAVLGYLNQQYAEKRELAALEQKNLIRETRNELRQARGDRNHLEARLKANEEALYFWQYEADQSNPTRVEFLQGKIPEQKAELERIEEEIDELEDELADVD